VDKRCHREEVEGVRLGHVPGDFKRVSYGVAKCSKKAFDEIEKAILFGDFGLAVPASHILRIVPEVPSSDAISRIASARW